MMENECQADERVFYASLDDQVLRNLVDCVKDRGWEQVGVWERECIRIYYDFRETAILFYCLTITSIF